MNWMAAYLLGLAIVCVIGSAIAIFLPWFISTMFAMSAFAAGAIFMLGRIQTHPEEFDKLKEIFDALDEDE